MNYSKKIIRNLSTLKSRKFWENCEKSAAEVASWPEWKKAGITVPSQYENYQRKTPRKIDKK